MYESGYYPAGAEHDPNAPWNQSYPESESKEIEYSCTMFRTAAVETTDYVPGTWEKDEDGFVVRDGDDFSDTDWLSEFKYTYRTPLELINLLHETAKSLSCGKLPSNTNPNFWKHVMADCENWSIDGEETEML